MTDTKQTTDENMKINPLDARAGRTGKQVLFVLIGAIILITIGLVVAFGTAS